MGTVKRIFVAQTPAEAHVVAGLLDEAGIQAVIEGEMLTGARFELAMDSATLPSVAVRDEDAPRALDLLREHAPAAPAAAEPTPASAAADEVPESRGLRWFKMFLRAWLVAMAIGFVVSVVAIPRALLFFAVMAGLAAIPLLLLRRGRRTSPAR